MKKLPLFLLGLIPVIIGSTIAPKANATSQIEGEEWWTPQELATHFVEKNTERETTCGADVECHNAFLDELRAEDELYRVGYDIFMDQMFIISSINRGNHTIDIYFNNDDVDISKLNPGWRDSGLLTLFLGWFDGEVSQIYEITDNNLFLEDANRHTLYAETYKNMGLGWLPSQTFVSVNLADLDLNETDYIAYFTHSSIYYARGTIDITGCKNDPNWGSCDLFISKTGEMRFFGPDTNPDDLNPDVPPDGGEEPAEEPGDEPAGEQVAPVVEPPIPVIDPLNSTEPVKEPNLVPSKSTKTTSKNTEVKTEKPETSYASSLDQTVAEETIDIPLVGKTASMTPIKCGKVDFPWWFLIMVLVGDIIAVWIFMPSRRQRIK